MVKIDDLLFILLRVNINKNPILNGIKIMNLLIDRFQLQRDLKAFIKGYASVLNLMPNVNDKDELKKDTYNVGNDFWVVIKKESKDDGEYRK